MIDLESLHRQLRQLRLDLATLRDDLHHKASAATRAHRTVSSLETLVKMELSHLHEKQPEI